MRSSNSKREGWHGLGVSTKLAARLQRTASYFRSRGWKDLIFLAVVLALGYSVRDRLLPLSDVEKWKARPKISPRAGPISDFKPGQTGLPPCFFIVPPSAAGQPVVSGSVGDCLLLVPDGRKLDLFEVNLLTGGFSHIKTDLYVPDTIPLAFTRCCRRLDDWSRRFQIYFTHVYDPYLFGDRRPYTYFDWVLPDGQSIHYRRISPGTGYADALDEHAFPTPIFGRSRIAWNGWGWDLSLEDGTTYLSPEAYNAKRPQQGSLVGIFDRDGNEVRLSRQPNGDLTEIRSPSGRWIRLLYDDKGRIIQARDSSGNVVEYAYDSNDRLGAARYPTGQTIRYAYDSSNRVVKVEDSSEGMVLESKYDSHGMLIEQTVGGRTYKFRYVADERERSTYLDITDPNDEVTRVRIQDVDQISHTIHYTVEKRGHVSPRR